MYCICHTYKYHVCIYIVHFLRTMLHNHDNHALWFTQLIKTFAIRYLFGTTTTLQIVHSLTIPQWKVLFQLPMCFCDCSCDIQPCSCLCPSNIKPSYPLVNSYMENLNNNIWFNDCPIKNGHFQVFHVWFPDPRDTKFQEAKSHRQEQRMHWRQQPQGAEAHRCAVPGQGVSGIFLGFLWNGYQWFWVQIFGGISNWLSEYKLWIINNNHT